MHLALAIAFAQHTATRLTCKYIIYVGTQIGPGGRHTQPQASYLSKFPELEPGHLRSTDTT